MNDARKYLGPNRKVGPGSYELGAIPVRAKAPFRLEGNTYFSGSWGLDESPHRGTGNGPSKLSPLTPFIWDDLMGIQADSMAQLEIEYREIFNSLSQTVSSDIEQARRVAIGDRNLSPVEAAEIDYETTIHAFHAKAAEYQAQTEAAYSLYGNNPFFLMKELTFSKIQESLALNPPNILIAYQAADRAYRAALELKRLSMEMNVLANKLPDLSWEKSHARSTAPTSLNKQGSLAAERLSVINMEADIRFELLPSFLVNKISAISGSTTWSSHSQALTQFKVATDHILNDEQLAIRPYAFANPRIHSPLSKPELEALYNLVDLQANTSLGKRWQDYHVSLLHSETVRYLYETTNAFSGLISRAQEAEHLELQLRIAAEQEIRRLQEQARIAAEAEVSRVAAEQARIAAEAEARRVATEAIRTANTFRASGSASAGPVLMTSAGTVAVIEAASGALQAAIRSAISSLSGLAASVGPGIFVGVSALVYSSKLANGELPERYAFSIPLSDLSQDLGQSPNTIATDSGTVDLPYRVSSKTTANGQSELFVVKTDGQFVSPKVSVVAATFNPDQNVYTATTADVPPRTLTWTPIVDPGNNSTTLPAEQLEPPVYTGATVIPVEGRIDTFPSVSEASFDDFITVFPAESGLPPVYTMFRDRREDPGVATGFGQPVSGIWLGAASQGEGAPVPSHIADHLRGKKFANFRHFRKEFWTLVANEPELARNFNTLNIDTMAKGKAPFAPKEQRAGSAGKFELHHKVPVSKDGSVYDLDNISIVTPKRHKEIHRKK